MVIEPSRALRDIMTHAFGSDGYVVRAAGSLAEAERLIGAFGPHVVVSELTLPDGTGDSVCRHLKANPMRLIPVVLVSGIPEVELARRAQRAGADRYHCKSRGLSELTELVEELTSEILF